MTALYLMLCAAGCRATTSEPLPVAHEPVPEPEAPRPSRPAEPELDPRCGAEACDCPDEGPCMPAWSGSVAPIDDELAQAMTGVSWRPGCPVGLEALAVLSVPHWTPDNGLSRGQLVVAAEVADEVLSVFRELYGARFPITRMEPVHVFDGSDDASMAADNTSAFNCRPVTGGSSYSRHSYGTAIDLNPLRNPYVRGERVLPPEGREWLERDARPGVITADGVAVAAFARIGWKWGGAWRSSKDYQHFSTDGR